MKLKVKKVGAASHPREVVVSVDTAEGTEFVVVHEQSLYNDQLEIGYPISQNDTDFLIELPRETTSGSWRVWVNNNNVF